MNIYAIRKSGYKKTQVRTFERDEGEPGLNSSSCEEFSGKDVGRGLNLFRNESSAKKRSFRQVYQRQETVE